MKKRSREERFWSKVDRSAGPDACWIWHGGHDVYGTFGWSFEKGKRQGIGAHRASFIMAYGPIDEGNEVCHKCDVPLCVNPAHLFQGTRLENAQDCSRKGRVVNPLIDANREKTHCIKGHEYTPENTYKTRVGKWVERRCKKCNQERRLAWIAAHPEENRAKVVASMARRTARGETPEQRERRLAYFRRYNAARRTKAA